MQAKTRPTRLVVLLPLLAIAAMLASLFVSQDLAIAATVDSGSVGNDTWGGVAQELNQGLAQVDETYTAGDRATAASQMSAVSAQYTSSNFSRAVHDTLGVDRQQNEMNQFQSVQQLTYADGHAADLSSQISRLSSELNSVAAELDASQNLAKPKAYAAQIEQTIKEQRKELQRNKKTKFHGKGDQTWVQVAEQMGKVLDRGVVASKDGDGEKGAEKVNEAYYQYYEKLGFEKNVMNAISGSRVSYIESSFKELRKAMVRGDDAAGIKKQTDELKANLVADGKKLDGGAEDQVNGAAKFITSSIGQSFLILVREGLEALLVVAAIIAYMLKSGNKKLVKWVYLGVLAGLIGSGFVALLFVVFFNGNGPQQEIMEGVVALIAMCMLVYASNWMLSKSKVNAWQEYIGNKAKKTVSEVSSAESLTFAGAVSLAMLSFLAVFREGAETVMFYQSVYSMTKDSAGMWIGGLSAAVVLIVVFVLIRFTSVRIPLRPFFLITSVLLALLSVTFAGGGVHSLIEGDLVNGTYLATVPTNEWLGLYPYTETIVAQIVVAVVIVGLFAVFGIRKHRENVESTAESMDSNASKEAVA
ncbi:high-affinity iron transporter [Bifidobacterium commune]|uniref:High-affinity iron transporter n=1 Tax=Bifidobacterium commune TaxID=1505727 RepID=A0A1C4H662_9BIFI|nr:FTR1 family protein [Bifidobacterium commune]MBB2955386.1 high-affinity iron transporter [Bifidobacterium commune]SCC80168.1 high-affinity iron transporter [Bifidobacterium commune]